VSEVVLQLLNGLFVGMSLALVAAGLALVFGVLRIVNFAQGELFMLGAYTVVYVTQLTHEFPVGVLAAVIGVGVIGGALMFILLWPLKVELNRERSPVFPLLATLGLSLILRRAAVVFFGGFIRSINQPIAVAVPVEGVQYPVYDLLIALVSGLALVATHYFLKYSRPGIWLRAIADNPSMAAALGVPLARVYLLAFIVSAGLSGLAGAMLAPVTAVYANLGQDVAFNAFVVIVAGGLSNFSVRRAAAFALVLGELQALGSIWFRPVAVQVFSIAVVVVALAIRARGRPLSPAWSFAGIRPATPQIGWRIGVLLFSVVLLTALVPLALGPAASQRATPILVSILVATAVAVLLRFGSVLNLGIGAVFGASAYSVAVFSGDVAPIWVLGAAMASAALVSTLYAVYAGLASGVEYMMLTFLTTAAAAKLPNLFPALAGGANGLRVRDVRSVAFGLDPLDGGTFYVLALCVTVVALALGWLLLGSQLGRVAEAAGRNPLRTASMGYGLGSLRLFVSVLAGGFAGAAGWIYAVTSRVVGQDVLGLDTSLNGLIYALGLLIVVYALPRVVLGLFTRIKQETARRGDSRACFRASPGPGSK
jgi:branched-subunit amino acid ABC-type transport system permease component